MMDTSVLISGMVFLFMMFVGIVILDNIIDKIEDHMRYAHYLRKCYKSGKISADVSKKNS